MGVDHLNCPVVFGGSVEPGGPIDRLLGDLVEVPVRVGDGVHRHSVRLFDHHRVAGSVDGWVDAHTEDVLVILGQDATTHDIAVVADLTGINIDHVQDARGARLDRDAARLVELVSKDILVVSQGEDELHDQLSVTGDDRVAGAPVGVLPADAVVLLMKADGVGQSLGGAIRLGDDRVEVFNDPKAVAAEGEIVGHVTAADISEIKSLLAMKGRPGISIRDRLESHG